MSTFKKATRPCHWCGRQTTSTTRVCGGCVYIDRRAMQDLAEPDDYHALTGGRWVPVGGIVVWQPMDVAS